MSSNHGRRRRRRRRKAEADGPVRRIGRNRRSITGFFPSLKGGVSAYESTLERDLFTLLEFIPEVESFQPQPVTVYYRVELGRMSRHVPDVSVRLRDQSELLIDVKYRDELWRSWSYLHAPFRAAYRYAAAYGWKYQIWTDVEIRRSFLKNAEFLLSFRRREISANDAAHVVALIEREPGITVGRLLRTLDGEESSRPSPYGPVLWRLISQFVVATDLMKPLSANSELSIDENLVHETWLNRLRQRSIL